MAELKNLPPDRGVTCTLSVDSPWGAEPVWTYKTYRTRQLAELFAHKLADNMFEAGYSSPVRAVFIRRADGNWRCVGSYFDVGARQCVGARKT